MMQLCVQALYEGIMAAPVAVLIPYAAIPSLCAIFANLQHCKALTPRDACALLRRLCLRPAAVFEAAAAAKDSAAGTAPRGAPTRRASFDSSRPPSPRGDATTQFASPGAESLRAGAHDACQLRPGGDSPDSELLHDAKPLLRAGAVALGMRCMCAGGRVSPAAAKPLRQWLQGQLRAQHGCPVLLSDAAVSLLVTSAQTVGLTRAVRLAGALPMLPPAFGLDAASASVSDTGLQARLCSSGVLGWLTQLPVRKVTTYVRHETQPRRHTHRWCACFSKATPPTAVSWTPSRRGYWRRYESLRSLSTGPCLTQRCCAPAPPLCPVAASRCH